jgi:hypothetical protein
MSIITLPLERNRYFIDHDGAMATTKREDEKLYLPINWTDPLEGATISSVAYVDSGVTRSSTTNGTADTYTYVTGLGETEITVTASDGKILQKVVRFYGEQGAGRRDYA